MLSMPNIINGTAQLSEKHIDDEKTKSESGIRYHNDD